MNIVDIYLDEDNVAEASRPLNETSIDVALVAPNDIEEVQTGVMQDKDALTCETVTLWDGTPSNQCEMKDTLETSFRVAGVHDTPPNTHEKLDTN